MNIAKKLIDWTLVGLCAYMVFDGLLIFVGTSGQVQGSEFGLLITLANQLSIIMLWLALIAVRQIIPRGANAQVQSES
jgi:hypothetical protein